MVKFLQKFKKVLVIICLCGISLFAGFSAGKSQDHTISSKSPDLLESRLSDGIFTNQLLDCEIANGLINVELVPFKSFIKTYVQKTIGNNDVSDIAVYYREMNNGSWFGIKESDPFLPASLLKVPAMMAYFKAAETTPEIFKERILFTQKEAMPEGKTQTIPPSHTIIEGSTYTVEDLIRRTIVYSDNQAVSLLYHHLNNQLFFDLYHYLGVSDEVLKSASATLSPVEYSRFFRILFNASYLNRASSEKALELLSKTEFNDGLVAGVPQGTLVSHKFGESGFEDGDKELHDCGILYYPKRPYLLCVMTKGKDIENLKKTIQDISRLVYTQINSQLNK